MMAKKDSFTFRTKRGNISTINFYEDFSLEKLLDVLK